MDRSLWPSNKYALLTSPTAAQHRNASFSFLLLVVIDTHAGAIGLCCSLLYNRASHVSLSLPPLSLSSSPMVEKARRVQQYIQR